jgi:hypothetical protein
MSKLIMIVSLLSLVACKTTDKEAADASAKEFIKNVDGAKSVVCADTDTDRDGYVSCTVFFAGDREPMQIQCGSETYCVNCVRGCKYEPAMKLRGRARPTQ